MGDFTVVIWIGVAIIAGGVAVAMFSMAGMVGSAQKAVQARADSEGQSYDVASRLRAVALERQKTGFVPDPSTEFERNLKIDGIAMILQSQSMQMPDTLRHLLSFLTVDELQEMLDAANLT